MTTAGETGPSASATAGADNSANPKAAARARPRRDGRPILFVTGHAPPYRVGAFACLSEREDVEFALFGGRLKHGGGGNAEELPFPHRLVQAHTLKGVPHSGARPIAGGRQARDLYALAASGRYRAVVCSTAGRVALPATWAGARRAGVPLVLWASLWAHPRSAAHAASYLALRRLYRSADAVVTYGPHVSAYVQAKGARNVHVAVQAVDNVFWSDPDVGPPELPGWPSEAATKFLFAGRPAREKGLGVLFEAWSTSGLQAPTAALVLVGTGSTPPWVPAGGAVVSAPPVSAVQMRNFYAACDVLVLPSIPTPSFREPWGLVANEAMNRGLPVIASDAVGAAAGGLVRDGYNGIVVPAGDAVALAAAMLRLAHDPDTRARMGAAAKHDVASYTQEAWAEGFSRAFASLSVSRER